MSNVDLLLAILILLVWVGGVVFTVRAHRKARRPTTARCPKCRYDMIGSETLRCPECGHQARSQVELYRRPLSKKLALGVPFLIVMSFVLILSGPTQRAFSEYVYRPTRMAVWSITAPANQVPPGGTLPMPTVQRNGHANNLVWSYQFGRTMETWFEKAAASDGSLASLVSLMPVAIEMHDAYQQTGGHRWKDSWPQQRVRHRLRGRVASIDKRSPVPLGTWAISELQYIDGNPQQQWDWTPPPREIMEALAESDDPFVQAYVVDRISVVELAWAGELLRKIASETPYPEIASDALQADSWRKSVHGWP